MSKPKAAARADLPEGLRHLQSDELVRRGDLVEDDDRQFRPWEGPNGFQAKSFVKPIYRRSETHSTALKEPA